MAANFARSLRATAPMLRWDQSWQVLVLLVKLHGQEKNGGEQDGGSSSSTCVQEETAAARLCVSAWHAGLRACS